MSSPESDVSWPYWVYWPYWVACWPYWVTWPYWTVYWLYWIHIKNNISTQLFFKHILLFSSFISLPCGIEIIVATQLINMINITTCLHQSFEYVHLGDLCVCVFLIANLKKPNLPRIYRNPFIDFNTIIHNLELLL